MTCDTSKYYKLMAAFVIAGGLAVAGYSIKLGLEKFRTTEKQTVKVKGIAERIVKADLAIWPIPFYATADTFQEAQKKFIKSQETILSFLKEGEFLETEISETPMSTIPLQNANPYGKSAHEVKGYQFSGVITVRTDRVDHVGLYISKMDLLLEKGVMLGHGIAYSTSQVRYLIRNFDALRPSILQEATQSARAMAEEFATHTHMKVGSIVKAEQGTFSIEGEGLYDGDVSLMKKIRLVNHVTYTLLA